MVVKVLLLVLFFAVMAGIGIYTKTKVKNVGDFVLGGRSIGPWLSAFAYGTSYFSAVIFIGYAGQNGWNFGLSATWIGIANAVVGSLLPWLILGKRTRIMTNHLDSKTMPDFFEKRYGSKALKIVSSMIIFIFLVPYSASVYTGLGYLFERTFGIDYIFCMIGIAVLTGLYLTLGGYMATAINDFIQGIIMLAGTILIVGYVVGNPAVGGLSNGVNQLAKINPDLTSIFGGDPQNLLGLIILTSLGVWGLPQMIHKFYSIKDAKSIKTGAVISTVFAFIIGSGAYFMGAFGRLYLGNKLPEIGYDGVMPHVLETALPQILMGIVIILVLSASMSTLAALVLTSSSTITLDLVSGGMVKNMKKKTEMITIKVFCIVFVAASVIIAISKGPIVTLMSISWGAIAGAFLAPFLYGLFWKGVTKAGVWAGFFTGIGVTSVCVLGKILTPPTAGAAAMFTSLIIVPLVSIATSKVKACIVDKEIIDRAFECLETKSDDEKCDAGKVAAKELEADA